MACNDRKSKVRSLKVNEELRKNSLEQIELSNVKLA